MQVELLGLCEQLDIVFHCAVYLIFGILLRRPIAASLRIPVLVISF